MRKQFVSNTRQNPVLNFVGGEIAARIACNDGHIAQHASPCMSIIDTDIPEGFERHSRPSPLTAPWEPIYYKRTAEAVVIGLRIAEPHTNSRGLAHGGLLTALADNARGSRLRL